MSLNVYLHFNGTCRQAFEFYRSLFGGDFDLITTFGEGPPDFAPPEDERDNVMARVIPNRRRGAHGQRHPI